MENAIVGALTEPVRGQPEMTLPETHVAYISKLEAQVEALKLEEEKTFRFQEDRILALAAKNRELQARIDELDAAFASAQQSFAAKDETIRRLANEKAALQYLVNEVRYDAADRDDGVAPVAVDRVYEHVGFGHCANCGFLGAFSASKPHVCGELAKPLIFSNATNWQNATWVDDEAKG